MTDTKSSAYRIERIVGGVAVYHGTARGTHNAARIFATTAEARAWIANR